MKKTMTEPIQIEALFTPGCASRKTTLEMIAKLTRQKSIQFDIREITIQSISEAQESQFPGSPTVRINGKDIEPASRERTSYGIG